MPAIEITAAGKDYGSQTVVDDVSLSVPEGRCVALIGHNGAGKTTLMKLILGVIRPTRGCIEVLGHDPATAGAAFRASVGFLPENVAFYEQMTGHNMLSFFARLKKTGLGEVDKLLRRVGLTAAAGQRIKTYSKGMRQRLGLAQALIGNPRLLLLDEPTTGLDPVLRTEFFEIIRELTSAGTTVLLSSHILTELEARTDLTAIMREGCLVAYGDLTTLRREAELPATIRIRGDTSEIAEKLNGAFRKSLTPGRDFIDVTCALPKKMDLLRQLAECSACTDVEVRLPTLDDLYVHFSGRSISARSQREETL